MPRPCAMATSAWLCLAAPCALATSAWLCLAAPCALATSAWLCLSPITPTTQAQWTHFASTPSRVSTSSVAAPPLVATWTTAHDINAQPINFVGLSGVVTEEQRVYAVGESDSQFHLYAFDFTGDVVWQSAIPAPALDSWSTPAVSSLVVVASSDVLTAFEPATGAQAWSTKLPDVVVNASPLIAQDRVFVTTFKPFGVAHLVCVDLATGELLWQTPIGAAGGATPSHHDGVIYIATADGAILAFDADAKAAPDSLWSTPNPEPNGFFSAPAVTDDAIYAASYDFDAGQLNANLIKLDHDGAVIWSTPSGRTDSTPIPIDGRVYLSTGLHGFGSLPSVQAFTDHGDHATLDWDTTLDSWVDANDNGVIDESEHLNLGGWTHQPIVAGNTMIVGTHPNDAGPFDAYTDLHAIDLSRHPSDPEFILDHSTAAGSTPALTQTGLFSIGAQGLTAFLSCTADCNTDGVLNILDFVCFQQRFTQGDPSADCNTDGHLNILDFVCYQQLFTKGCAP